MRTLTICLFRISLARWSCQRWDLHLMPTMGRMRTKSTRRPCRRCTSSEFARDSHNGFIQSWSRNTRIGPYALTHHWLELASMEVWPGKVLFIDTKTFSNTIMNGWDLVHSVGTNHVWSLLILQRQFKSLTVRTTQQSGPTEVHLRPRTIFRSSARYLRIA